MIARGVISPESRIIMVNDGSMDLTWRIIEKLHEEDSLFGGINLRATGDIRMHCLAG